MNSKLILAEEVKIHMMDAFKRATIKEGDLIYMDNELLTCTKDGEFKKVPKEGIITLAKVFQKEKIKDSSSVDVEEVDYLAMAKDVMDRAETEGVVQVLDGTDHPDFSLFPGNNAESLKITIHYIEVNGLQNTAPWSAIWNLWKCLEAVSGK